MRPYIDIIILSLLLGGGLIAQAKADLIPTPINLNEETKVTQITDFPQNPGRLVLCDVAVHFNSAGVNDGCRGLNSTNIDDTTVSDVVIFGSGGDPASVFILSDRLPTRDNTADIGFGGPPSCGVQSDTCQYLSETPDEDGRELTTYHPTGKMAGADANAVPTRDPTYLIVSDTPVTPAPEPATTLIFGVGLLGIFAVHRAARRTQGVSRDKQNKRDFGGLGSTSAAMRPGHNPVGEVPVAASYHAKRL